MKWWNKLLAFAAFTGAVVFVVEVRNMKGDSCCAGGVCALPVPQEKEAPAEVAMAERSLPKLVDLGAGKCVLIDVTASWCKNCKAMEKNTFPDEEVQQQLEDYVFLKYVSEDPENPNTKAVWEHFGVQGPPAYYVLKPIR